MIIKGARKWKFGGIILLLVAQFLGCNLSDEGSKNIITLSLNTDATGAAADYDSVRVDIQNVDGTPFKDRAFVVKRVNISNNTLTFDLGQTTPSAFIVVITGYLNNTVTMKVQVKSPNNLGKAGWIVLVSPKTVTPGKDSIGIAIEQRSLTLIAGSAATQLKWTIQPPSAPMGLIWNSSAPEIAAVDSNGSVLPLREGDATLTVRMRSDSSAHDQIPVTVKKAGPSKSKPTKVEILTASPLTIAVSGTPIRVQAETQPTDADQGLTWQSLEPLVVAVDEDGVVSPGREGSTSIIATSKADPALADTLRIDIIVPKKVESIQVSPKITLIYLGGAPLQLTASVIPVGQAVAIIYASNDKGIVEVSADGRVTAKSLGNAFVVVQPVGNPGVFDTCKVTVVKDIPTLDAGQARKVAIGEEVVFNIRTSQKYGGISILKWDLDGNSIWDPDSVKDSIATPKFKYGTGKTEVTAHFYVRDTEGNIKEVSVKISIGSPAPLVDITKPSKRDTLVNKAAFTIEYLADGINKITTPKLVEGKNEIEVADTNAAGIGRDTVDIYLDTQAPIVEITSPLPGTLTNNASISVAWTSNHAPQTTRLSESLAGKQGRITITRDALDSAGNYGIGSIDIFRDTIPPAAPIFTSSTSSSPTNNTKPSWVWTGTSGGNGTFRYSFNGQPEVETGLKSFTPATLGDGSYTLIVRELDSAANLSDPTTRTIIVQTKGPGMPVVTGSAGPTKTPQWIWTRAVAGSTFMATLYKAGEPAAQDSYEGTVASYSPAGTLLTGSNGLVWTLRVKEKDALGNWSEEGSAPITVDVVAPNAPAPSVPQYSLDSPYFTWTAPEAGAKYIYRLVRTDNGTTVANGTLSALTYNPGNVVEDAVSYKLFLAAQDLAGNTGTEAATTTLVDLNAPAVVITGPSVSGSITTENPTISGTTSDANGIKSVAYSVEGGASGSASLSGGTWAVAGINFALGTRKVTITATDSATRTSTSEITITKLANVVFVRKGGTGLGGKSWQNAYKELSDALSGFNTFSDGTEIWVAEGSYSGTTESQLNGRSRLSILGGFSPDGTGRGRTERAAQIASSRNTILTSVVRSENLTSFILDGFQIVSTSVSINNSTGIEIRNCTIRDMDTETEDNFDATESNVKIINSTFYNNTGSSHAVLYINNSTVEFSDAVISGNKCDYHEGPVLLTGPNAKAILLNSKFTGNTTYDGAKAQIGFNNFGSGGGTISIDAASLANLEGGVCKIGRRANGTTTDINGTVLTCP